MPDSKSPCSSTSPPNMSGPNTSSSKQTPTKMHRRSRTGCFTCRLRRKKCDEGKPGCKACKHLGLKCEYKRPMWWSNNEQRRQQKDNIKNIIKRTKLTEKAPHPTMLNTNSPPSLCHVTLASDHFADGMERTRGSSLDSQFSVDFGFNQCVPQDMFNAAGVPLDAPFPQYPHLTPYEVDIQTETQMFINDVPTRKDSTISTFSAYQTPTTGPFAAEMFLQQESYFEHRQESFTEEPIDFNFFEVPYGPISPSHNSMIQVDNEYDRYLLNHFIDNVVRLIFPVMDVNQHGSPTEAILLAMESNKAYLHCCLSVSAMHLKATQGVSAEQIDTDIVTHNGTAVQLLCGQMNLPESHAQALEGTLAMMFLQNSVKTTKDSLQDLPWHAHFEAATKLVDSLDLPAQLVSNSLAHPPFNMSVTAWIDILGASMLGRRPQYAVTYHAKHLANSGSGLAELMGCDDLVMYLISEIACLEEMALSDGIDKVQLCSNIKFVGDLITESENMAGQIDNAYSATGALRPKQLRQNMTAVFRTAARLYLCSLIPGSDRQQPNITHLVDSFATAMNFIPAGPDGFDRSLVWPLLIAGSASLPSSLFRSTFYERIAQMGDAAEIGSISRLKTLLEETWLVNDEALARGERQSVHWRDVMQQRGWDFLLI